MTNMTLKSRILGGAAVVSVIVLAGCSSVPDAINPVEWYKSTVDLFSGDEKTAAKNGENKGLAADKEGRQQAEAKAQAFPKVADVPGTPVASSDAERAAARQGLIADREQRRYASAPIPRQEDDSASGLPTAMASVQPPPPAAPAVPVTPAPMRGTGAAGSKPVPAPAQRMASAPPPPPAAASVEETYRNKLAQRFKPIPGAEQSVASVMPAPPTAFAPANAMMPAVNDPLATVIISSDGVEAQGSQSGAEQPVYVTASSDVRTAAGSGMARTASLPGLTGGSVKIATILFSNGSASMSDADVAILRQVSALLKDKGGRLRVVGHASSRTRNMDLVAHKMTNFQLSADRADRVAKALIQIGVAPELISIVARSDADPVYYEVMPSGEAGNRRTEIYLDS